MPGHALGGAGVDAMPLAAVALGGTPRVRSVSHEPGLTDAIAAMNAAPEAGGNVLGHYE
ncbi:hypothetical protein [Paeniglutamicibacter cryotolerans]|uniref:Uncharacterized protein n=1 Tax=Paeniglutamicibacter cryotolerans TaxID=670079 RepID=A0A839QJI2_9MICC|nr:hypothetical protein [Paeniglutamicibacter cryotolerans]MBB2996568.1 hypothetical protein [Paeniglutamicibacter cryotolerans]